MKTLWAKALPVIEAQAARFARLFVATFTVSFAAANVGLTGPVAPKAFVSLIAAVAIAAAEAAFRQWISPVAPTQK